MKLKIPRKINKPIIASGTHRMAERFFSTKPSLISGLSSQAKIGPVAATTTMPSTAREKIRR